MTKIVFSDDVTGDFVDISFRVMRVDMRERNRKQTTARGARAGSLFLMNILFKSTSSFNLSECLLTTSSNKIL